MSEPEIGHIQNHTSDPDGGCPDVGMLLRIDSDNAIWIGEISSQLWKMGGEQTAALGADGGWWIVHYGKGHTVVIGKCIAGWPELNTDFMDILAAAIRRQPDVRVTDERVAAD